MAPRNSLADVPIFLAHPARVFRRDFANTREKVETIAALAADYEQTEHLRRIAGSILGGSARLLDRLRRAHQWRADSIDFESEQEQILQTPDHILERRRGDCTAHGAIGAALALLAGADVALVTMGGEEHDPEHLSMLVSSPGIYRARPPFWMPWSQAPQAIPGWVWSDSSTPGSTDRALAFGQPPGPFARAAG